MNVVMIRIDFIPLTKHSKLYQENSHRSLCLSKLKSSQIKLFLRVSTLRVTDLSFTFVCSFLLELY